MGNKEMCHIGNKIFQKQTKTETAVLEKRETKKCYTE